LSFITKKRAEKDEHCSYCGKEVLLSKHQENCDFNPRFIRFKSKEEIEAKFEKKKGQVDTHLFHQKEVRKMQYCEIKLSNGASQIFVTNVRTK